MTGKEAYLAEKILDYVRTVSGTGNLEARLSHFMDLTRSIVGAEFDDFETDRRVSMGRVYASLGNLVFEFAANLHWHGWERESQLKAYIADLKSQRPQAAYTAIITDGLHFHVYRPGYDESGRVVELESIRGLNLASPMMTPEQALQDLDTVLTYLQR